MKCGKCKFKINIGNTEEQELHSAQEYLRIFPLIVKTTAIFYQGRKNCIAKNAQDWGVILPV